jgi:hypothetical protein
VRGVRGCLASHRSPASLFVLAFDGGDILPGLRLHRRRRSPRPRERPRSTTRRRNRLCWTGRHFVLSARGKGFSLSSETGNFDAHMSWKLFWVIIYLSCEGSDGSDWLEKSVRRLVFRRSKRKFALHDEKNDAGCFHHGSPSSRSTVRSHRLHFVFFVESYSDASLKD